MQTKELCRFEQRVNYTIGIGFMYRVSVIVSVRHCQHGTTGRPGRLGIVRRVADGYHLVGLKFSRPLVGPPALRASRPRKAASAL